MIILQARIQSEEYVYEQQNGKQKGTRIKRFRRKETDSVKELNEPLYSSEEKLTRQWPDGPCR